MHRHSKFLKFFVRYSVVTAVTIPLYACDGQQGDDTQAPRSAEYIAAGDLRSGLVELQKEVQANPEDGELRRKLGEVRLTSGDPGGAEKELLKALEFGVPQADLAASLGRSYLTQGKFQELVGGVSAAGLKPGTEEWRQVRMMRAAAQFALNDNKKANKELQAVLQASPGNAEALVLLGRIALRENRVGEADNYAEMALRTSPQDSAAWVLSGRVAQQRQRYTDAVLAFGRALEIRPDAPNSPDIMAAKALALLSQGDKVAAFALAAETTKRDPGNFTAEYVLANEEFAQKQYNDAETRLQHVLEKVPDYYPAVLLLAHNHMMLGHYQQAETLLLQFLAANPDTPSARLWLAEVREKGGDPKRALAGLEKAARRAPATSGIEMERMARLALDSGKTEDASKYLQQAIKLQDKATSPEVRTAAVELSRHNPYQAKALLEQREAALAAKPVSDEEAATLTLVELKADETRIMALMGKKAFTEALSESQAVAQKAPESSIPYNLMALAQIGLKDNAAALGNLNKAVEIDPNNVGALHNLAFLYIGMKQLDEAAYHFEKLLKLVPGQELAMLGMANVALLQGRRSAAIDWLRRAGLANPSSILPRVNLGKILLQGGDADGALLPASEAYALQPNSITVLDLIGKIHLSQGNFTGARNDFQDMVELAPKSVTALMQLSLAESRLGNYQNAVKALQRAISLQPGNAEAYSLLVQAQLLDSNPRNALKTIAKLKRLDADRVEIDALTGDAHRDLQRYAKAEEAYRRALKRGANASMVRKIYYVMIKGKRRKQAADFIEAWLQEHPNDVESRTLFAQGLAHGGDVSDAQTQYRKVLAAQPENGVVLNNLAILLDKQGEYPGAIEYAAKANRLYPGTVSILDTLGWLLVREGDLQQGLAYLQQAVNKAPSNPELLYHLSVAQARNGDREQAADSLQSALKLQPKLRSDPEVQRLLKELGGSRRRSSTN
jgi:putative PEP-CTERM system TPR-repeat lipoprotein